MHHHPRLLTGVSTQGVQTTTRAVSTYLSSAQSWLSETLILSPLSESKSLTLFSAS